MRHRSRGFSPGRSRRKSEWFQGPGGTAVTSVSSSTSTFLGSAVQTTAIEETLVRTRGILDCFLTSATSPGDGFFGAFGIGRATAAAVAGGVTTVPTPITELGWDGWLYHTFISCHESSADEAGSGSSVFRIEVDSKAMRILQNDENFYAALEVIEIGTAAMSVFFDCRMLTKLP